MQSASGPVVGAERNTPEGGWDHVGGVGLCLVVALTDLYVGKGSAPAA